MDSAIGFKVIGIFKIAVVFLSMDYCVGVPVAHNTSATQATDTVTGKQLLRVNSTIPSFRDRMAAVVNSGPLEMRLCEYAGRAPLTEDITASAVSWGCYAVEQGVPTIPVAVYWMQESNTDLWQRLRDDCGCTFIFYSVPYLRLQQSTRTWLYSTKKVPVGTSCPNYESKSCSKIVK